MFNDYNALAQSAAASSIASLRTRVVLLGVPRLRPAVFPSWNWVRSDPFLSRTLRDPSMTIRFALFGGIFFFMTLAASPRPCETTRTAPTTHALKLDRQACRAPNDRLLCGAGAVLAPEVGQVHCSNIPKASDPQCSAIIPGSKSLPFVMRDLALGL